ncbi:MAG: hypothetical protein ACRDRH_11805 [Pseudonocardia sp.]
MTTPKYLQQARDSFAAAAETARRAEVLTRSGLAYAAANGEQTVYLVCHEGQFIGELHHPIDNGALTDWHAVPDRDPGHALGRSAPPGRRQWRYSSIYRFDLTALPAPTITQDCGVGEDSAG